MKFQSALFIACLLLLNSCHKDVESEELVTTTIFTAQVIQEMQGNVLGYVFDENNKPVEGALVEIYSGSTKTNKYGVFTFTNSKLDKNGTYLTVRKQGYFLGSDMIYPNKAESHSMVRLMKLESGKIFDASKGGTISITGGGLILFPADAIAYEDGAAYNGSVTVSAKFLSPIDPELPVTMPGGLVGDKKDKTTVALGTAGMIAVELRDDKGQKLNLSGTKKATLSIPALSQAKPSTILLWSFDESLGRWIEEGQAALIDGNYIAELSHFSFWNCDAPFPLIHVCGKLINEDGSPVKNAWVNVEVEGFGAGSGITDDEGIFCGKMPKGKLLTLKVYNSLGCGDPIIVKAAGPFEENTQLDPITVTESTNKLIIKGRVDCDGVAVEDAILIIKANQWSIPVRVKADGSFNENLSYLFCQGLTSVDVFAFDESSAVASSTETVKFNEDKSLLFNVCSSGCPMKASFNYNCTTTELVIDVTNGSGNYTYDWNKGSTTNSIKVTNQDSTGSEYCVVVTDNADGCVKEFCAIYTGSLRCYIDGWCSPILNGYAIGGFPPYTYIWSDGQTTPSIGNLSPGKYVVTVSDSQGCTTSAEISVSGEFLSVSDSPVSCNKNMYSLASSSYTKAYLYTQNGTSVNQPILNMLDLFMTGFTYTLLLSNNNCERTFPIKLPQLTTMEAVSTNSSCTTCNDGFITITTSADCYQCTLGNIKVLGEDKTTDYTASNTTKTLSKGFYYIVAEDLTTGCYIGISKVNVK
jgi:hypothetical protein